MGNINPLLYTLAVSAPTSFHDITKGNNEIVCLPGIDKGCPSGALYGYPATSGYDCATGLGSIDGFNLATAWAGLAATSTALVATPTTTSVGSPVTLTATVSVPAPNSTDPGGTVRFAFQAYTAAVGGADAGTPDLTWTLGTDALTSTTTSSGTATFTGPIPPGLVDPAAQYVDVVAMYGGDATHLASTSAKVRITFPQVASFCLVPSIGTIQPEEGFTFTAVGGTPPILWYTGADSTCDDMGNNCSTMDESTGAFRAGINSGYVVVVAVDSTGLEQVAYLTVGNPEDAGPPPWPEDAAAPLGGCMALPPDAGFTIGIPDAGSDASGATVDSGIAPEEDSGTSSADASVADAAIDAPAVSAGDAGEAGVAEGGPSKPATVTSGCGCVVVGGGSRAPAGALAGVGLGLGLIIGRRRRRTSAS
jgi:hypothetical protein